MDVYLFSGLGADERLFRGLDLGQANLHFIRWPMPLAGEKLEDYANRVSKQVLSSNSVLIGVSFGGMVATEVAKIIPHRMLITISSANQPSHLPYLITIARYMGLHRFAGIIRSSIGMWIFTKIMGTVDREHQQLLQEMLRDTQPQFIKSALPMLMNWKPAIPAPRAITIHGKDDHIIPARHEHDLILPGGHAIVLTRAREISCFVRQKLGC